MIHPRNKGDHVSRLGRVVALLAVTAFLALLVRSRVRHARTRWRQALAALRKEPRQMSEGLADAGREEPDALEREPPFDFVVEHLISVRSMSHPLRLITAVAFGQLLAAALLLVLHPLLGDQLATGTSDFPAPRVPLWIFRASLVSLALALSFLLSGALQAPWSLRLLTLGLFTVLFRPRVESAVAWVQVGLLLALWVWGIALWLAQRGARAPRGAAVQPPWARSGVIFVTALCLVVVCFVLLWWPTLADPAAPPLPFLVDTQLHLAAAAMIVALLLAGSDFAELGAELAHALTSVVRRVAGGWPLVALTCAVALVDLRLSLREPVAPLLTTAPQLALLVLVLGLVVWWAQVRRWHAAEVPPTAVVAPAAFLMGFSIVGSVSAHLVELFVGAPEQAFAVYRYERQGITFSIAYPRGWESIPDETDRDIVVLFSRGDPAVDDAAFSVHTTVRSGPLRAGLDLRQVLQQDLMSLPPCQEGRCTIDELAVEPWRALRARFPDGESVERVRYEASRVWFLRSVCSSARCDDDAPVFEQMVASWRPDLSASLPPPLPSPSFQTLQAQCPPCATAVTLVEPLAAQETLLQWGQRLAAALFASMGLVLITRGRQHPGPAAAGGLFVLVFAAFALSGELGVDAVRSLEVLLPVATLGIVVVLGVLLRQGCRGAAGMLSVLFVANAGLLLLWHGLYPLYDFALSASENSLLVQALVLLVAFAWDMAMSGKHVSNVGCPTFPRHARMLMYFGYTMFVTTMVLYYSSQLVEGDTAREVFEADLYVRDGIGLLGLPLLLTSLLIGLGQPWPSLGSRAGKGS